MAAPGGPKSSMVYSMAAPSGPESSMGDAYEAKRAQPRREAGAVSAFSAVLGSVL